MKKQKPIKKSILKELLHSAIEDEKRQMLVVEISKKEDLIRLGVQEKTANTILRLNRLELRRIRRKIKEYRDLLKTTNLSPPN